MGLYGRPGVGLHTSTVQLAAQKLYEKHDYHEVGRETHQQFEIIL